MITYAFNITFTRPDENDATVYTVGYNAYGRDIDSVEKAEAQVRRHNDHLTILNVKHVATLGEDGEISLPLVREPGEPFGCASYTAIIDGRPTTVVVKYVNYTLPAEVSRAIGLGVSGGNFSVPEDWQPVVDCVRIGDVVAGRQVRDGRVR